MNGNAPNIFQPIVDVAINGFAKIGATIILGTMIYVVVVFTIRLALPGRKSSLFLEFRNLLASAVSGLSMIYLLYLGLVVMEPPVPGASPPIVGPFMVLAFVIAAALGSLILLLVLLGAGKTPQRIDERPKRRRRTA